MLAVVLALSGCAEAPPPTPSPTGRPLGSFLGGTFEAVTREIPPDIFVIIQDVSVLADADPTYTAVNYGSPEWTVLALCADRPHLGAATSVEVAVIPHSVASSTMIANAREGAYSESVTCGDRPYRASPESSG
ncbi:hypothetical protein [Microbacterium sp. SA39]|uniref:hypothetical protein n=1 Tax=Microbacterium sp. SA39 TaxID=1263625 RepID=UPI0005FA5E8A|nr:hypothetical protein [Microbacterium sp. SA39]KJQ55734.1 hypothetical protein RS85_00436 [Microbacterium sp. SA39]